MFHLTKIRRTLCVAILCAFSSHGTSAETSDKFHNWKIECVQQTETSRSCHTFQDLLEKETKQRVLHIAVGHLPGDDSMVAIMTLPLGISLPPGIRFRIDQQDGRAIPVQACFTSGCQAAFKLDSRTLDQLKKGKTAEVIFHNMGNQAISIPVSLKGFTAAVESL